MTIRMAKVVTWAMVAFALLAVLGNGFYYASTDMPREVKRERSRPYMNAAGMLIGVVLISVWTSALTNRNASVNSSVARPRRAAPAGVVERRRESVPRDPLVVPPNLLWILGGLLVGCIWFVGAPYSLLGPGSVLTVVSIVTGALSLLVFGSAAIGQRPRIVISDEGFVLKRIIGEESHKWDDVEGPFEVIRIGIIKAVAYNFTSKYKAQNGKKPTPYFSGFDAALSGAFKVSAQQLADLLNERKENHPTAPATNV